MKRSAGIFLRGVLALIIATLITFILFLNSERALKWAFARFAPPGLSVKSLHGSLLGPIRMEGITYSSKGMDVSIGSLIFDWMPTELFSLDLHISRLEISKILITSAGRPTEAKKQKPLPQLRLPFLFSLEIDSARARDIEYVRAGSKKPLVLSLIRLSAFMRSDTLRIRRLEAKAPEYSASVQGTVKPRGNYPLSLKMKWAFVPDAYPRAEGAGDIEGTLEKLHISQAIRAPYNTNIDLTLTSVLTETGWTGSIGWHSLQWPPAGKPVAQSPRGRITSEGNTGAYHLSLDADFLLKGNVPVRISTAGTGNMQGLSIDSMRAAILGGQLYGNGKINWKPISWAVKFSGTGLNTDQVSPEWKGNINFQAVSYGSVAGSKRDISMEIAHLTGVLRGYPLNGSGRFRVKEGNYFIPGVNISSGTAKISASGRLMPQWDLSWNISAKNMCELVPGAEGSLFATGTLTGNGKKPVINVRVKGANARYKDLFRAGSLESSFVIDLSDSTSSSISLVATGLQAYKHSIQQLQMKAAGKLRSHQISLSAKGGTAVFGLALKGGYASGLWNGTLSRMSLYVRQYGRWGLIHPSPLKLSRELAFADVCMSNGIAEVCLKADWQRPPVGSRARLSARRVPLGLFQAMLPPGLLASGTLSGNADISYTPEKPIIGNADIKLTAGALAYSLGGKKVRLSFRESGLDMQSTDQAITINFEMPFLEGGGIRSRFSIPQPKPAAEITGMKGDLHMDIPNLAILSAALPAVEEPRGLIRANLEFSGSLKAPDVSGAVVIEKGSAVLPQLGITVTDVILKAESAGRDKYQLEGGLRSGGTLSIKGDVTRTAAGTWLADVNVKGDNFNAIKTREADVIVSPDLVIALEDKEVRLKGDVIIPRADITPVEISGAVKASPDVVVISSTGKRVSTAQLKVYADVKAILGDKINFKGFGLTSRISGTISVHEEPGKLASAQGELVIIKGTYKAYGQDLDIQNGKLLYSGGPVDDPGLAVKAVRKVGEVTAGINVSGTLHTPKLGVFSDPPMDQSEALSYLILGKPLHSASSSEGNKLYGAATSLGIAGGQFLAKKIGRIFGIQEVSVEKTPSGKTPGQEEATLFLGRYLSPRLYIAYGTGVLESSNVFRVRYNLTKEWMVQAESGTQTGADMLFKLEWK